MQQEEKEPRRSPAVEGEDEAVKGGRASTLDESSSARTLGWYMCSKLAALHAAAGDVALRRLDFQLADKNFNHAAEMYHTLGNAGKQEEHVRKTASQPDSRMTAGGQQENDYMA